MQLDYDGFSKFLFDKISVEFPKEYLETYIERNFYTECIKSCFQSYLNENEEELTIFCINISQNRFISKPIKNIINKYCEALKDKNQLNALSNEKIKIIQNAWTIQISSNGITKLSNGTKPSGNVKEDLYFMDSSDIIELFNTVYRIFRKKRMTLTNPIDHLIKDIYYDSKEKMNKRRK